MNTGRPVNALRHASPLFRRELTRSELLNALEILLLWLQAIWSPVQKTERPRLVRADVDIHWIADAARRYQLAHHRWPTCDELEAASTANGFLRDLRDPWDHRYELEPGDTVDLMVVRSLGPDGDACTEDDIVATVR